MMFEHDDYAIECADGSDRIVMRGVMRLPTPAAFDQAFAPIAARIDAGEALRLDICDVPFMNSSGIRALATLVLRAGTMAHGYGSSAPRVCRGRRRHSRACEPSAANSRSRPDGSINFGSACSDVTENNAGDVAANGTIPKPD